MGSAEAGSFTDHPRKILFRRNWVKPILHHLHARINKKFVYLGLPGIKAYDIKEWQEFIRKVVAFQAANYDDRDEEVDAEAELDELLEFLSELELKTIIDNYVLYTGYIEDVVITGQDDNGAAFNVDDYITIYNLDFCNSLITPRKVYGRDPNKPIKYKKTDVIEKLLSIQKQIDEKKRSGCFLMFLTVHSWFIEEIVSEISDPIVQTYISKNLRGVTGDKRMVRLLKAFTFYTLSEIFAKHGIHVEFLPTIYYQGHGTYPIEGTSRRKPNWLTTFTILGTPVEITDPQIEYKQNFKEFLEKKFVFINDQGISCYTDNSLTETDFNSDIVDILSKSETLTQLWVP